MVEELKTKVEAVADDDGEGQEELEAKVKDLADTYKYKMEEDKNQTKEDFNNSLNNELNKIELAKLQSSKEKIETRLQALNNIESKTNEINVQITSLEAILTSIESTIKSKQTLDEGIQGNTNQKTSIKVETQTETPEQRANGFIDTFLKADDAGRGALSNLLKQDWNKTYLTSLSIAVANRISNHPNIEKSDPLNFLQQYVNGLLNKTDMQERIEKGEEKATKIVENVKQLFDYFTKGEFMKAIFKLFEAWGFKMSSSGERGTTSYREVPKALTPQDQVDQLLSQIDSLDNNPDLKNHKPILEKIQKVLKAGEKATEEDIKVLQKGLQGNEVLKKNEKLHDAFLKEAFTEKEGQKEATGTLGAETQKAMQEVLAKVREEVTPVIAQKEAEKNTPKAKSSLGSSDTIKAGYIGANYRIQNLEVDKELKDDKILFNNRKFGEGEKGDGLLKDIKKTFEKIGDPKKIPNTTIDDIDKQIENKEQALKNLNLETATGKETATKLGKEITKLKEDRGALEKYLNLLITQIKDVVEKINLAKNHLKTVQDDIKKSGDTSEQTQAKLKAIEKYETALSYTQGELASMTEGLLGSLSSKTLNDNVKTALLDTILPSLPENTKIHVNEAMKNKLANNTTDKYLTIERESRPIYFEPRERVSEFTAGTETHRRRQIIGNDMKLDVQIAKNGQNLSHFVTEVKLSNIHIFCNIKATNDGKYSIDCKFTSDVIRTLPTEELKKFIENIGIKDSNENMTTTFNEAERTVSIKGEDIEIKKEDLPLLEKFTQLIQKAPINADKARLERWAKQNDLPQDFIGKILGEKT